MDNESLNDLVRKIPELKFKYLGSFPPDLAYPIKAMPQNSFQIVNTQNESFGGEHWVVIIKDYSNKVYFGDSLGKHVKHYPALRKKFHNNDNNPTTITPIIPKQIQSTPDMCGFYTVYFAYRILSNLPNAVYTNITEYDVLKFIHKYYSL